MPAGPRKRFRTLFKASIHVSYYRCSACGTWWLHEDNPRHPEETGWTMIGSQPSLLHPQGR